MTKTEILEEIGRILRDESNQSSPLWLAFDDLERRIEEDTSKESSVTKSLDDQFNNSPQVRTEKRLDVLEKLLVESMSRIDLLERHERDPFKKKDG